MRERMVWTEAGPRGKSYGGLVVNTYNLSSIACGLPADISSAFVLVQFDLFLRCLIPQ